MKLFSAFDNMEKLLEALETESINGMYILIESKFCTVPALIQFDDIGPVTQFSIFNPSKIILYLELEARNNFSLKPFCCL